MLYLWRLRMGIRVATASAYALKSLQREESWEAADFALSKS